MKTMMSLEQAPDEDLFFPSYRAFVRVQHFQHAVKPLTKEEFLLVEKSYKIPLFLSHVTQTKTDVEKHFLIAGYSLAGPAC